MGCVALWTSGERFGRAVVCGIESCKEAKMNCVGYRMQVRREAAGGEWD